MQESMVVLMSIILNLIKRETSEKTKFRLKLKGKKKKETSKNSIIWTKLI